jgi:hypothetical protein
LQNPLLSLTTNAQSPNIDYNSNLYNDQYADDDYADDQSSVNYDSYISHTDDIDDTNNINDNIFQEPFMIGAVLIKNYSSIEKYVKKGPQSFY